MKTKNLYVQRSEIETGLEYILSKIYPESTNGVEKAISSHAYVMYFPAINYNRGVPCPYRSPTFALYPQILNYRVRKCNNFLCICAVVITIKGADNVSVIFLNRYQICMSKTCELKLIFIDGSECTQHNIISKCYHCSKQESVSARRTIFTYDADVTFHSLSAHSPLTQNSPSEWRAFDQQGLEADLIKPIQYSGTKPGSYMLIKTNPFLALWWNLIVFLLTCTRSPQYLTSLYRKYRVYQYLLLFLISLEISVAFEFKKLHQVFQKLAGGGDDGIYSLFNADHHGIQSVLGLSRYVHRAEDSQQYPAIASESIRNWSIDLAVKWFDEIGLKMNPLPIEHREN
ncbi:hypothetical protein GQX74_009935 [Glossina fuscipes]|nr:hypothetical protein GQX74_009935 [Glossina fuscipes]